jgi:hypothetical protein
MNRVSVPGGGWFDLRDLGDLNSDHQDEYTDLAVEIREGKRRAAAAAAPANPAVAPDPNAADDTPVRVTQKDMHPLRDLVLSWVLADSSFGVPVQWPLPLPAANVLRKALEPYYDALNGDGPKEDLTSPTSATTSAGTAPAPQPAPPAVSSATPGG